MTQGPGSPPADGLPDTVRAALATAFPLAGPDGVVRAGRVARRGRMSESARLLVRESDGSRRPVFAKWPSRHAGVRRVARHAGAYRREVMFYRDLAGECGAGLPEVHHSTYDPETGEFVLLLEDLATARPGDDLRCSVADVRRALRAVAKLHASWADGRLDARPWLPAWHGPPTRRYTRFELGRIARAAARGRFAHAPVLPLLPLLTHLDERLDAYFEQAPGGHRTLVHGDLHMDQVLLPEDGGAVIVDWQLVQLGPGGVDIARLLVLSLPAGQRRRYESELLDTYRSALAEYGGPAYDSGVLLDEYRRGLVWTAFLNTSYYLSCAHHTRDARTGGFHDVMFGRITAGAADHGLLRGGP